MYVYDVIWVHVIHSNHWHNSSKTYMRFEPLWSIIFSICQCWYSVISLLNIKVYKFPVQIWYISHSVFFMYCIYFTRPASSKPGRDRTWYVQIMFIWLIRRWFCNKIAWRHFFQWWQVAQSVHVRIKRFSKGCELRVVFK